MASFERLKSISLTNKNLINGYIRNCEIQLFGDLANENPYYHIPPLVNNYCMLFYEIFAWYKKNHGDGMQFVSDTEVKQITNGWSTCMFENEISDKICDTFSMTFKIVSLGIESAIKPYFCIGYAIGNTLEESLLKWNGALGGSDNSKRSGCWGFSDKTVHVAVLNERFKRIEEIHLNWACDDLVKISFDFLENKIEIYHNDKELDSQSFNERKVWIGLSMYFTGSQIEMVQYQYHNQ